MLNAVYFGERGLKETDNSYDLPCGACSCEGCEGGKDDCDDLGRLTEVEATGSRGSLEWGAGG